MLGAAAAFTQRVGASLLDLAFPPSCAACREPLASSEEEPFCPVCREAVDPVPSGCRRCAQPGPDPTCGACLADPPAFEAIQAGALFGGPLADAIHGLKYQDRPALARPLGRWLASRVEAPPGALLIPVPLSPRRRIARGYDQAALVARHLARATRRPLLAGALLRVRETAPQVGQSRAARAANVAGAFRASPAVAGRDLWLVDDVVTTGATARACALALRQAGARRVEVVALARAE